MPSFDEPLLENAEELPAELRVGLERLRARRPSPERLAAMAAAVGAAATASSAASPASAATQLPTFAGTQLPGKAAALVTPTTKVLLVLGVIATGALAVLLLRSTSPEGARGPSRAPSAAAVADATPRELPERGRPTAPSSATISGGAPAPTPGALDSPSVSSPAEPTRAGSPELVEAPSPTLAPSRADAPRDATPPSTTPPTTGERSRAARTADPVHVPPSRSPGPAGANAKVTEAELLRDARQVLDRSPVVALSLCEEHRQSYPNGGLVQERELIAIAALLRLGRTSSAEERAARFRAAYPRSPHLARLDRLLPP